MSSSQQSYEAIHSFLKKRYEELRRLESEKTQTRIEDVARGIVSGAVEDQYNIALEQVLESITPDLDLNTRIKLVATLHLTPLMTRYMAEQIDLVLSAVAEYLSQQPDGDNA